MKNNSGGYDEYAALSRINTALGQIFGFAVARDEVDFAFSLGPEFRGAQDAGWNTAEEAIAAFKEGLEILNGSNQDRASVRNLLYRYLCIAEASGMYEVIGNHLSIIGSDIYKLWPFKDVVVRHAPTGKIKAPNANRIFRELSEKAEKVGLVGAAKVLAEVFDDDLRNAVAHADFVIWNDGLRLRKRNGGHPVELSWKETSCVVRRGLCFFDLLLQYIDGAVLQYADGKVVVGKGSANEVPFEWLIKYDVNQGSLSISSTSPGTNPTPNFLRTELLKSVLGDRVLVISSYVDHPDLAEIESYYRGRGIEPDIKLHSSRAEHAAFVKALVQESADSIFLSDVPRDDSTAVVITTLGAIEATTSDLDLVLPSIPMFTIGPAPQPASADAQETTK